MTTDTGQRVPKLRWLALLVLCVAQALEGIDATVVNVALPTMATELGFGQAGLVWVINAYMITFGGFLLLAGRLGDLVGRRRLLIIGLAAFTAASVVAGAAPTAPILVAARAAQGLAAALVAPMTLALIAQIYPAGRERNRALAVWGAVLAVSGAAGLLVGGALVEQLGWRWIFFVNVPLGVVLIAGAGWLVPRDDSRGWERFDLIGAITATAGTGLLVYATQLTSTDGWTAPRTALVFTAAVLLLAFFVVQESRLAAEPLIAPSLVRDRLVVGALLVNAFRSSALYGMFFFVTLYQQEVLGRSPLETGVAYLPMMAVLMAASGLSTILVRPLGTRWLVAAGLVVAAVGAVLLGRLDPGAGLLTSIVVPSAVLSFGIGLIIVPTTTAGLSGLPAADEGAASGLLNVSLQLGGALGLAVLSSAAAERTANRLAGGSPPIDALRSGFGLGFGVAAALLAGAAVVALALLYPRDVPKTDTVRRR